MEDVVGFGSLNVDYIYEAEDTSFLESFCPGGEKRRAWVLTDWEEIRKLKKILSRKARLISRSGGGSAANTVYCLAKMGFTTGMMGKTGRDEDASFLAKEWPPLRRLHLARNQRTGQALIILGPDRDRVMLLLPCANQEITWADLNPDFVREFRMLHMTSILGIGLSLQERLAREVSGEVQISFDPGEVYARRGLKDLASILTRCYILFITQGELELMTGRAWEDGVKKVMDLGTRIIAVKRKGSGAFIQEAAAVWELPAPIIQAKDTTGAGDVFAAGFLGGYLRGLPLPVCGSLGLAMAHQSMGGVGREAYPTREDFETAVKRLV